MLTDKEFEYTKALANYFADKTKNGIPPGQFNAIFARYRDIDEDIRKDLVKMLE